MIERDCHGGGSVMVWAGVSLHYKTDIVFIKGHLTAARYQHEELDTEVIPLFSAVAARKYSSPSDKGHHCISQCKQCKCRQLYPKSPDLNVFEIIWDKLNCGVRRTGAAPTTLNQLRAKILYQWNNRLQNYVKQYVTSMRRRCLVVVNSAGGHTYNYVYMDMDAAAGFDLRIL